MPAPKPASPCEHDAGTFWILNDSMGSRECQSKSDFPICPYCKPAQKPASSCCGAEIKKAKYLEPPHYFCSDCGDKCNAPEIATLKPAESCEIPISLIPDGTGRFCLSCGREKPGCDCGIGRPTGKAETQDAGEIAHKICGDYYSDDEDSTMIEKDISEAIERERANATEYLKLHIEKWEKIRDLWMKKALALEQKLAQADERIAAREAIIQGQIERMNATEAELDAANKRVRELELKINENGNVSTA